jgi:hypothetical protein
MCCRLIAPYSITQVVLTFRHKQLRSLASLNIAQDTGRLQQELAPEAAVYSLRLFVAEIQLTCKRMLRLGTICNRDGMDRPEIPLADGCRRKLVLNAGFFAMSGFDGIAVATKEQD